MDRGTQWFSAHSAHGLTALSVWLIKQGIRLRVLAHFRREYNEVRPHEALEMETPASRWGSRPRPVSRNPQASPNKATPQHSREPKPTTVRKADPGQ